MPVTLRAAADFLAARFGTDVGTVEHVGAGEWSVAYGFRRAGQEYVIRFGALAEDFEKDRLAARYVAPGLPIPRVVEIGETGSSFEPDGGYYAISERVYGAYIDSLDADQLRAVLPALFAALDAARRADVSATRGYGSWGADGTAPHPSWQAALLDVANDRPADRIAGWRAKLATSPVGTGPFDVAYAQLQALVNYAPTARHLIHSDLLHDNVLVSGDRITGVLDWGCAMYGDFLYDLAWLCFWAPWFPAWAGIDFREEARRHYAAVGLDVPHFEERLRACQIHIGLSGQAYNAYKESWVHLPDTARRTLEVARGAV